MVASTTISVHALRALGQATALLSLKMSTLMFYQMCCRITGEGLQTINPEDRPNLSIVKNIFGTGSEKDKLSALQENDERLKRVDRIHNNDIMNIPLGLMVFYFAAANHVFSDRIFSTLVWTFTYARLCRTTFYYLAVHPMRAGSYFVSLFVMMFVALNVYFRS